MKRLLLENIVLKISAVVLAVILWLFVVSKGMTEISLSVPIEYANMPAGLEIARYGEKTANVVIRIHESIGKNIRQENVTISVDVSKAKKGEGTFPLRKDDVKVPFVATVVKVEPSTVKLVFDERASRKVPVKAVISGSPEEGYYVKGIETDPKDIVIEGVQSEVRKVGQARTEVIDITGLTEDVRQEVGFDMSGLNIRTKADKVAVHIRIGRRGK